MRVCPLPLPRPRSCFCCGRAAPASARLGRRPRLIPLYAAHPERGGVRGRVRLIPLYAVAHSEAGVRGGGEADLRGWRRLSAAIAAASEWLPRL